MAGVAARLVAAHETIPRCVTWRRHQHRPQVSFRPATGPSSWGLGTQSSRDDGVGLAVVSALRRLLEVTPIPGVDVLASTRAGFELIELLRDYRRAILVDCLALPDPQPGRVRRLGLDDVSGSSRLVNVHELSVGVAFQLAERMGIRMPTEVEILAIEAGDTCTITEATDPGRRGRRQSPVPRDLRGPQTSGTRHRASGQRGLPQTSRLLRAAHRLTASHEQEGRFPPPLTMPACRF